MPFFLLLGLVLMALAATALSLFVLWHSVAALVEFVWPFLTGR